ncbi:peroxiredoxin [Pseudomethylobacillus aquaticus]|uniref:thioredoxin-dependent peroxiredoxin n=1 Tax=Pseudomethylobacillus aquaticus TaxID=2676064 RepID=A0A3N0V7E3_9PROT|nr:peroxiredoxin [Pseudomethylobacillus aquaticus]ROH88532.1 peroxiredoxin [Pseudomethylobacillus aquaticus]
MLQPGTDSPDFSLPDADMELVKLSRLRGKHVVLYFYPKDDTPGCTVEAIEFSDLLEQFDALNCVIIGISRDDCISHADFRDKHGLSVTLLADVDGEACQKFGVWQEKEKDGVRKMGIVRSTFVINSTGQLCYCNYKVAAKGHAAEVLHFVQTLQSSH